MTALSRRMEILVFPGSDFTMAPRRAREKSMSRYFSATTRLIVFPLALVRLPRGNQPERVRFLIRVNHDKQVRQVAEAKGREPRLVTSGGILACEGEVVLEDRDRFRKAHAVCPEAAGCMPPTAAATTMPRLPNRRRADARGKRVSRRIRRLAASRRVVGN